MLKDADYTLVNEAEEEFHFDQNAFWGVSYDNPDYTQAYEPIFKLMKAEKEKDGTIKKMQTAKRNGRIMQAAHSMRPSMCTDLHLRERRPYIKQTEQKQMNGM